MLAYDSFRSLKLDRGSAAVRGFSNRAARTHARAFARELNRLIGRSREMLRAAATDVYVAVRFGLAAGGLLAASALPVVALADTYYVFGAAKKLSGVSKKKPISMNAAE
jgi:hypothetical protein